MASPELRAQTCVDVVGGGWAGGCVCVYVSVSDRTALHELTFVVLSSELHIFLIEQSEVHICLLLETASSQHCSCSWLIRAAS